MRRDSNRYRRTGMKKVVYILACILLLHISHYAFGIEPDETGLKTGGDLRVPVIVLGLQEAKANVGLDEEMVREYIRHQEINDEKRDQMSLGV